MTQELGQKRGEIDQILCRLCPQQYEYACTSKVNTCQKHQRVKAALAAEGVMIVTFDKEGVPESIYPLTEGKIIGKFRNKEQKPWATDVQKEQAKVEEREVIAKKLIAAVPIWFKGFTSRESHADFELFLQSLQQGKQIGVVNDT